MRSGARFSSGRSVKNSSGIRTSSPYSFVWSVNPPFASGWLSAKGIYGLISKTGVPSIISAPVTTRTGIPFSPVSTAFKRTTESPSEFGRNEDLVANTPTLVFPPSRGGRTVGDHFFGSLTFSENSQISQRWENSSIPRTASGLENSGSNTIRDSSSPVRPLCLGIPNFVGKSVWILATGRIL